MEGYEKITLRRARHGARTAGSICGPLFRSLTWLAAGAACSQVCLSASLPRNRGTALSGGIYGARRCDAGYWSLSSEAVRHGAPGDDAGFPLQEGDLHAKNAFKNGRKEGERSPE